jgi:hypothetical protein
VIDDLIGTFFGGQVKVQVALEPAEAAPKRMTKDDLRAERLAGLRKRDPALDAAANELDLEIVDDSPRSPSP